MISVVTMLTLLLSLELLFRAYFPQPLYATALAPWGFWHQPNAAFVHASDPWIEGRVLRGAEFLTHIRYNSLGIRGPEYAVPKPVDVKRVVVLGDSFGDAMEVEFPETMGQVLQRRLDEAHPMMPVRSAGPPRVTRLGDDTLAIAIWRRLREEVASSGASMLVGSLRIPPDGESDRRRFFDAQGLAWVSLDLGRDYRFRFDGHWNVAGNARAAELVGGEIVRRGMLELGPHERVEVINLSHAAFDTCQYLRIFQALGRTMEPSLVVVIDSGIDSSGSTDDLCALSSDGTLVLEDRQYSWPQRAWRNGRSFLRANSHFLTWVITAIERIRSGRDTDRVPVPIHDP